MQNPELYHKAHKRLKGDTGRAIKKYLDILQWRNDGSDVVMDVGHGTGDFFMDFIYPEMPKEYEKVICADILKDMLEYSRTFYKNPKNFEFRQFDVRSEEGVPSDLKGMIHHLTAIHLLHWVKDFGRGRVLKNIYDLLHPDGGDCLLAFMPSVTVADVNDKMKSSKKWGHYLHDITEFLPSSDYSKDVGKKFRLSLEEAGFGDVSMEETTNFVAYENVDKFKEDFIPVCGILKYIPQCRQSEFLDDCIAMIADICSSDPELKHMTTKYCYRYKLIVVHAKRLPN